MNENEESTVNKIEDDGKSDAVQPSDVAAEINTTAPVETAAESAINAVTAPAVSKKKKPRFKQYAFLSLAILLSGRLR